MDYRLKFLYWSCSDKSCEAVKSGVGPSRVDEVGKADPDLSGLNSKQVKTVKYVFAFMRVMNT